MNEICRFLDWDTNFFGLRIAQVLGDTLDESRVGPILKWRSSNKIDCLYFLASAKSYTTTHTAQNNGFELMDFRMEFKLSLNKACIRQNGNLIRPATADDVASTSAIARDIHKGGRFHYDPRFAHKADEFYGVWITNSISGFADRVFVCEVGNSVAGYVTCKINGDGTGQIGLIGVGANYQGLGIGRGLINAAADWFEAQGCGDVLVVTQGRNISAQALYQKCGFVTSKVNYWYHRWK